MRHVITGGPGVGKTTTLNEIAALGYETIPEAARSIISEEQEKEDGLLPWTDLLGFQYLVLHRQLAREHASAGDPAFLDRGVIDNIAYCRLGNVRPPTTLERVAKHKRYGTVFLLDPLPHYATDTERKEDATQAKLIHEAIGTAYRDHGYRTVNVPVLPPRERAEFMLYHI